MTDRLDVFARRNYTFVIAWDDEGYEGLTLGDDRHGLKDPEHLAACEAAKVTGNPEVNRNSGEFEWETESAAKKALRAARAAVKAVKAGKPWPEWALKAQAEGWKPPRNWTPE